MPGKGYSNLTIRRDVREQLDRLREELGFSTLNDLVDPGFYSGFLDKLRGLRTSNEDLIRRSLGEEEFKLFMFLRENGLIYFDGVEQSWRLVE